LLDRSQPANLFDAARPESEAACASTRPLPRLERTLPPHSRRARRPRPVRAPRASRASVASRLQGTARPRLAEIASAARRQARFLPAAIVVLILLAHPVGCGRSTPAAPARRATVGASRSTVPVSAVTRPQPAAGPRPRPRMRRARRAAAHRLARALTHASPAPAPTRGPVPSSDQPSPAASATRVSAPAPAYVPPAPSRSYTRSAPSANASEGSAEFGFEAQAAHQ
jgi:hypothetical protein